MARTSKTVLSLAAISSFFGDYFHHAVPRGENALASGHLLTFSYNGENYIKASVHASMRNTAYIVEVK